jgi:hypothetical protein
MFASLSLLGGCATLYGRVDTDPAALMDLSVSEGAGGVWRIKPSPLPALAEGQALGPVRRWGWALDALAGGAMTQVVPWATRTDAVLAAVTGGLALTGIDYWLHVTQPRRGLDRLALSILLAPVGIPAAALVAPVLSFLPESVRAAWLHELPSPEAARSAMLEVWPTGSMQGKPLLKVGVSKGVHAGYYAADLEAHTGKTVTLVLKSADGTVLASRDQSVRMVGARPAPAPSVEGLPSLEIGIPELETPREKNLIWAEKGGTLFIPVSNVGKGPARGVRATLALNPPIPGLNLPEYVDVGLVAAGGTAVRIEIPITAAPTLPSATSSLEIRVEDVRRADARPVRFPLVTRALELPRFHLLQNTAQTGEDGELVTGRQFDVVVEIKNQGGWAEDARVRLKSGDGDIMFVENSQRRESDWLELGDRGRLRKNASDVASWSMMIRNAYSGPPALPLSLEVEERHPEARKVLHLDQIVLHQKGEQFRQIALDTGTDETAAPMAPLLTAVDVDEPLKTKAVQDPHALALVIGIGRYNPQVPGVPFAGGDAARVRTYMTDALGVPPQRVFLLKDDEASKTRILTALKDKLGRLATSKSDVYVYFAGHGAPDPQTGEPYLVPYDGDPQYIQSSFVPLSEVYGGLARMGARSATVMLDSCFSGNASRTDGEKAVSLIAGRPVAIQEKRGSLPAGLTVLTATSINQISSAWRQMKHGLFTYYLLKGLRGEAKNGAGSVTVRSLADYLGREVPGKAAELLLPGQEPQVQGEATERVLIRP